MEAVTVDRCSKTALCGDTSRENVMSFIIQMHVCKMQELIRQYKVFVIRGQVQFNGCRDPTVALTAI